MIVINSIQEMQRWSREQQKNGSTIGFVPTMGALHEGHLSLVDRVVQVSDVCVLSVFVNPTQFGPSEDYDAYPRTLDTDAALAETHGCNVVFAPAAHEVFPAPHLTSVSVAQLQDSLCGASRPGHFDGVTLIVSKLFNMVLPDVAVFGQKDAQQAIIIKQMVRDLNYPVQIIVAPIVRESDGLAMSSRNTYLTPEERRQAVCLSQGLQAAESLWGSGEHDAETLMGVCRDTIAQTSLFSAEYVSCVNCTDLNPLEYVEPVALLACAAVSQQSKTRLIDNCTLGGTL